MNTQERALEKAKEKVEALLWESPEGLTISNITGDLRISVPLAKSALKAIGAVYEGGVWVLRDDDAEPVAVIEPAIGITDTSPAFTSQPVEKQSVDLAAIKACTYRDGTYECRGDGYLWDADADGWDPIYKDWPCPACNKEEYDRDMAETEQDEPTPTKSDFALAVEAEREKVLGVIQSGATLSRVVELTGLHIDDAQHHVDVLVDLGRVVARPVVVAVAYEVVA